MTGEANQPGFRRVRSSLRRIAVLVGRRRMEAPAYGNGQSIAAGQAGRLEYGERVRRASRCTGGLSPLMQLGIDPAANVARVAMERGIDTVFDFFGAGVA